MALALLAYPATALIIDQPWPEILYATFVLHIEFTASFLFIITGCVIILSGCAGSKSQQVPTITGNNNTITINQAPTVEKASKTSVDAAGSGYGGVKK